MLDWWGKSQTEAKKTKKHYSLFLNEHNVEFSCFLKKKQDLFFICFYIYSSIYLIIFTWLIHNFVIELRGKRPLSRQIIPIILEEFAILQIIGGGRAPPAPVLHVSICIW